MPVEDVDYLIENSEKDSITFFIDSSSRNKNYYPDPASYVVEFSEPIKNVYGIEVLDASIPVSMYNIDYYNNIYAFSQIFFNKGYTTSDFQECFQELQDNTEFNKLFEANASTEIIICNADSFGAAYFDSIKNDPTKSVLESNNLYLRRNVFRNTSTRVIETSLEVAQTIEDVYAFKYQNRVYLINNDDPVLDVITTKEFSIINDSIVVVYDYLYITDEETQVLIDSYISETGCYFDMYLNNNYIKLEEGNYDSGTLLQYMTTLAKNIASSKYSSVITREGVIPFQNNAFGQIEKQSRLKFLMNGTNPFIFDMQKSTCNEALGFSTIVNQDNTNYTVLQHRTNNKLYMSKTVANPKDPGNPFQQKIIAPCIINLMGLRYILLRCPEIENHLLGSHAYGKFSPGMGMFKLASGMDITNLRFDFVSLVKKPFHPIGKLSRLTLSFETRFGELYDFKGVDHNMLLMIKYYSPKQGRKFTSSILNPNYDPNFMNYTINHLRLHGHCKEYDEEEEEEDVEEGDDEEFKRFLNQQNQYQYDSGEDDV